MPKPLLWGYLIHLSHNMWLDTPGDREVNYAPYMRCDDALWAELTELIAEAGMNALVIDVGDGIEYASHPEISVEGAWSSQRLAEELDRLRGLGLEPIPKLNFSAGHDAWLGPYSRQLSTPAYYQVCDDLIGEVSQAFGQPRLFHIGMDEEDEPNQRGLEYAVIRQHNLWWHDLEFLASTVEKHGSRAWIWSDVVWHDPETFYRRMPKSIMQSNWYYESTFTADESGRPRAIDYKTEGHLPYLDLDEHGYDQIPTGSTWSAEDNFAGTVKFCTERLDPSRLHGFLQTPWKGTLQKNRDDHLKSIEVVAAAIREYNGSH